MCKKRLNEGRNIWRESLAKCLKETHEKYLKVLLEEFLKESMENFMKDFPEQFMNFDLENFRKKKACERLPGRIYSKTFEKFLLTFWIYEVIAERICEDIRITFSGEISNNVNRIFSRGIIWDISRKTRERRKSTEQIHSGASEAIQEDFRKKFSKHSLTNQWKFFRRVLIERIQSVVLRTISWKII